MPRSDLTPTSSNQLFYRAYQHVNDLIRKHRQEFAHFRVDIAADPRSGLPGSEPDTTYFIAD